MKRSILHGFMLLCLIAALLCSAVACQQADNPEKDKSSILGNFMTQNGFTFEHYDWYITKSDFFTKSNLTEEDFTFDNDFLTAKKDATFEIPYAKATLIYNFDGGKLVSGQYLMIFSDEAAFLSRCRELKSALDEGIGKPHAGVTDELVHMQYGADNNVAWMGEDGSSLSITVHGNSNKKTGDVYDINIQVVAPPAK